MGRWSAYLPARLSEHWTPSDQTSVYLFVPLFLLTSCFGTAASSLAQRSHLSVALARLLVVLGTGSSPVISTRSITNVVASQPGAALAQRRGAANRWKPAGGAARCCWATLRSGYLMVLGRALVDALSMPCRGPALGAAPPFSSAAQRYKHHLLAAERQAIAASTSPRMCL
ncbi:hypothetical protein TGAM01_v200038 [Trichoderma gamsii]|uniref:Uncharacterized protein n=1 Tax=Trichoderma gamsii TaxID=398673 RepID=A0A2P5A246_9HYPO|nr:hypothetical protein TGAM01_v200038 [Trichoderma gamsii]PON30618.1 hypothetical protein TGAM01_v200038 [Trichoderma gamsii]